MAKIEIDDEHAANRGLTPRARNLLLRLSRRKSGVTAEEVLSIAKDKSSPLHNYFEWSDDEAANRYRLWQARVLIQRVRVHIVDDEPDRPIVTRAIVHSRQQDSYISLDKALSNQNTRDELLDRALREHEQWERRYEHLTELEALFKAGKLREDLFKKAS